LDAAPFDANQPSLSSFVNVAVVPDAVEELRPTRERKRRRRSKSKRDKRLKTLSKGINSEERKDLRRADGFATVIRRPLRTTLDFHPAHMDEYPAMNLDVFFQELRKRISTWCRRKRVGSYWVWTRENYVGDRREHLHMVMHLPPRLRHDLEDHLRSLYPGDPRIVKVGERTSRRDPETGWWSDGLVYRTKQLRGDAVGKPGPTRLRYETKSRHDSARVAPVLGKRCGVSKTLEAETEERWLAAKG
jgi:hypothetical protein